MENKEILVEKIAKAICPIIQPIQCRDLCTNVGNCQELKDVCRKVINGFSKDDTAVVIPKAEYERLMNINPPEIPVLTQDHLNYITQLENREKALEKCLKAANDEIDQRMYWWESCRKETTYGLLKRLYNNFVKNACVGDCYTESDIEKELLEIAKECDIQWKLS